MNLSNAVVLLTGATGGIGRAIAEHLLERGALVLMTGRDMRKLQELQQQLAAADRVDIVAADLTQEADRRVLIARAMHWHGGVNVLLNNAGVSGFQRIENQSPEQMTALVATNLSAPLQLSRGLLPHLCRQPRAHILNIGSVYGAIGYPGYAVYCATKFGMRGFTEALRRELSNTSVRVHYLAPRATRTSMNSAAAEAMNEHMRVAVDPPAKVARAVCRMLEREQRQRTIGWPEKLFVHVNALLPKLVDSSVLKQLSLIQRYADAAPQAAAEPAMTQPSSVARTPA